MSNSNIFNCRKGDATAYVVFYVVVPVLITYLSLSVFPSDTTSGVYCYVTILVSALNSIYDGANRWKNYDCVCNSKILIMWGCDAVIVIYCLYVIFSVCIVHNMDCRKDFWLFSYIGVIGLALWDWIALFIKQTVWKIGIRGE